MKNFFYKTTTQYKNVQANNNQFKIHDSILTLWSECLYCCWRCHI